MLRLFVALIALGWAALPGAAQPRSVANPHNYLYYKTTSLSGAVEKVTLQQPASSARFVSLQSATIYCSAACTWTLSQNGTAATGTAGTEINVSGGGTAVATVWHTSNAGAGTTLASYVLAAGAQTTIDLSAITLEGDGTAKNVSLATNSITATVYVTIQWQER
jgi:hypothetical protein